MFFVKKLKEFGLLSDKSLLYLVFVSKKISDQILNCKTRLFGGVSLQLRISQLGKDVTCRTTDGTFCMWTRKTEMYMERHKLVA
jgi:hypothetical protein